jgi:hypothetical protein
MMPDGDQIGATALESHERAFAWQCWLEGASSGLDRPRTTLSADFSEGWAI